MSVPFCCNPFYTYYEDVVPCPQCGDDCKRPWGYPYEEPFCGSCFDEMALIEAQDQGEPAGEQQEIDL